MVRLLLILLCGGVLRALRGRVALDLQLFLGCDRALLDLVIGDDLPIVPSQPPIEDGPAGQYEQPGRDQ